MQKLIDKLILLGLCVLALSMTPFALVSVIAPLAVIAVSSLNSYLENRLPIYLCASYVVICMFVPEFAFFLPLIVYDCAHFENPLPRFCWIAALPFIVIAHNVFFITAIVLFSAVAFLLHYKTNVQLKIQGDYFSLMDDAKERAAHLERRNRELMEKQDYEVRLATLAERNRIAREIHDNVGHLLTRSILQISALRVVNTSEGKQSEELDLVRDTLSEAMDSIRSSVHDLRDESVDLKMRLDSMIDKFTFCPVKLNYNADDLPVEIKICFASIVREALSNIAKHSNAAEAAVTVTEHPAFFQLVITDNGTVRASKADRGIGLQNMTDRIDALGGIFRVESGKGFRIFISVPKGELA
ncbi:MAG: sensor histidine kinase [Oscillospiraceae bacterium]|nr:sensor histidine kinase [Oscillospiraceae bacterium]